jgi:hypothetical protein
MKTLTREQLAKRKSQAVRFTEDVLGDPERADEIRGESLEEYAERKRIELTNPMSRGGNAMGKSLRQRVEELEAEMPAFWYSKRTLLSLIVIVLGANIGFYWIRADLYQVTESPTTPESERNERSTPRSFILPATPAVAVEQETRSAQNSTAATSKDQIAVCAIRLIDLGYDVGDEAVVFNAKLSEAVYEYQEAHGLHKTGKLDPATIRSLSCKVK